MHTDQVRLERAALPMVWLATPAMAFSDPGEVLDHPSLSHAERRAILASWASDIRAVEDAPWLRRLDNGANIRLSEVLESLKGVGRGQPRTNSCPPARRSVALTRLRLCAAHSLPLWSARGDFVDEDRPDRPAAERCPPRLYGGPSVSFPI